MALANLLNFLRQRIERTTAQELLIVYRNWKGVEATRRIFPVDLWWGKTKYHQKEQWFIKAIDLDKRENRDFALVDIVHIG